MNGRRRDWMVNDLALVWIREAGERDPTNNAAGLNKSALAVVGRIGCISRIWP
jgi:hypothetical protein